MSPVHLSLFAWQGHQAQIRFRRRSGPMLCDEVAKVIGAALVTTFSRHDIEAAGGKAGELLQGLKDEGQPGIDLGRASRTDAGQAGLPQDALDAAVMDVQLPGNGADAPFLDMVETQNLGFELRGQGHGDALSGWMQGKDDESDRAGSQFAPAPLKHSRRNGSSRDAVHGFHSPSERREVKPAGVEVGNTDASLSRDARGSAAAARHACGDHEGSFGNAGPRHAATRFGQQ